MRMEERIAASIRKALCNGVQGAVCFLSSFSIFLALEKIQKSRNFLFPAGLAVLSADNEVEQHSYPLPVEQICHLQIDLGNIGKAALRTRFAAAPGEIDRGVLV